MAKVFYPAVIEIDEDGYYFVQFPYLNGCATQGNDFQDACRMAEDALGEWLSTKKMFGDKMPIPHQMDEVIEQFPNSTVLMFGYDEIEWEKSHSTKAIKRMVSIPEWLDHLASQNGLSLSKVLQAALKHELNIWAILKRGCYEIAPF